MMGPCPLSGDSELLPGAGGVKQDHCTGVATSLGRDSCLSLSGIETGWFHAKAKWEYLNKIKSLKVN